MVVLVTPKMDVDLVTRIGTNIYLKGLTLPEFPAQTYLTIHRLTLFLQGLNSNLMPLPYQTYLKQNAYATLLTNSLGFEQG